MEIKNREWKSNKQAIEWAAEQNKAKLGSLRSTKLKSFTGLSKKKMEKTHITKIRNKMNTAVKEIKRIIIVQITIHQ